MPEALSTIAEVALGLAGFSGVAVVLGRRPGAFTPGEAGRLVLLLLASLGAMFLALLPLGLAPLDLSPELLWRIASTVLLAFCLGYGQIGETHVRLVRSDAPEIYSPSTRVFNFITFGTVIGLQVLALVRPDEFGAGFYVLGLIGLLLIAAVQFVRILFIRPQG